MSCPFRVFSAIIFGAMALGQATAFAPDYGKGKSAADKLFYLLNRESAIDNISAEGTTPVRCFYRNFIKQL